ncbi:hypothetical protein [Clostridium tyrobutyricum]|uniref:hypothetical protein n=1 Tax=Clostridium tyrobutyricum TaxID=1519 RepID=UPI002B21199E|nr:hypothetical protein [Clostridium tyrobutyricum]MEA5009164.1 hypothetical protein [Clostridium tyrobutyricum]
MSDTAIIVISVSVCITALCLTAMVIIGTTALCLTAMVIIGTYLKDRLVIKGKSSIGKLTKNEISITAEDKEDKNSKN